MMRRLPRRIAVLALWSGAACAGIRPDLEPAPREITQASSEQEESEGVDTALVAVVLILGGVVLLILTPRD